MKSDRKQEMGNGVSGKASANLKTIYLEVHGQKQKVSMRLLSTATFDVR